MFSNGCDHNLSVYIADDSEVLRESLTEVISEMHHITIVGEAGNGTTACEEIFATRPDVAILDIRMPGMNGIAVSREFRRYDPDMAVIIFTSHDLPEYRERSIGAGADYFFHKTKEMFALLGTLEDMAQEKIIGGAE